MLPAIEPRFFGCRARSQFTIDHTEGERELVPPKGQCSWVNLDGVKIQKTTI
jgi:hypothetical protein